jgi:hypothetical protein
MSPSLSLRWVYWYLLGEPYKSGAEMGNPNPTEEVWYFTYRDRYFMTGDVQNNYINYHAPHSYLTLEIVIDPAN